MDDPGSPRGVHWLPRGQNGSHRGHTGSHILCPAGGTRPKSGHAHMKTYASRQHYTSTQDTLLSNFDFLHYTKILHCLKDQYLAFGPPLWASGPVLHSLIGHHSLGGLSWTNTESLVKMVAKNGEKQYFLTPCSQNMQHR